MLIHFNAIRNHFKEESTSAVIVLCGNIISQNRVKLSHILKFIHLYFATALIVLLQEEQRF